MFNVFKDNQKHIKDEIMSDFILCQDKMQTIRNEKLSKTSEKRYKMIYKDIFNSIILYYYNFDVIFYKDGKVYQIACDDDMRWKPALVSNLQINYGITRELGYRTEEVNNCFKRACRVALYLTTNNKNDLDEDDIVYLLLQE